MACERSRRLLAAVSQSVSRGVARSVGRSAKGGANRRSVGRSVGRSDGQVVSGCECDGRRNVVCAPLALSPGWPGFLWMGAAAAGRGRGRQCPSGCARASGRRRSSPIDAAAAAAGRSCTYWSRGTESDSSWGGYRRRDSPESRIDFSFLFLQLWVIPTWRLFSFLEDGGLFAVVIQHQLQFSCRNGK